MPAISGPNPRRGGGEGGGDDGGDGGRGNARLGGTVVSPWLGRRGGCIKDGGRE